MSKYIHISSSKVPVLPGEKEEIINPGTYGKSFAEYLKDELTKIGYIVPFICCEDWGWWVQVKLPTKSIGICCYREHDDNKESKFTCTPSIDKDRVWSWSRF